MNQRTKSIFLKETVGTLPATQRHKPWVLIVSKGSLKPSVCEGLGGGCRLEWDLTQECILPPLPVMGEALRYCFSRSHFECRTFNLKQYISKLLLQRYKVTYKHRHTHMYRNWDGPVQCRRSFPRVQYPSKHPKVHLATQKVLFPTNFTPNSKSLYLALF